MNETDYRHASSPNLARLFQLDESRELNWSQADLRAIFDHQMNVRVASECELKEFGFEPELTFREALLHPSSPEPLEQIKNFSKNLKAREDDVLPADLAGIIYLASIASAWLYFGEWMTKNSKRSVLTRFTRSAECDWIDQETRDLFQAAAEQLRLQP